MRDGSDPERQQKRLDAQRNCDDFENLQVRLILNGKEAWKGGITEFFDQPGATFVERGRKSKRRTIPVSALIKNSNRSWRSVRLFACTGKQQFLDAGQLTRSPERYQFVETRKRFLKLVERQANGGERTVLRDVRTIEMN